MGGRRPEERVERPVTYQRWSALTFLHWPFDVDVIQACLPDGFKVDAWGGLAWVGMTPFVMSLRVAGLPPVRGMSTFPETNLRTYVRGPDGCDGIWFFSLEADCLPLVLGARTLYGVPYRWADMRVDRTGDVIRYRSRRRLDPGASHDIRVHIGPPLADPPAFDGWSSGRWRAWTHVAGHFFVVPVDHLPWPLHEATLLDLDETLLAASGLTRPLTPPRARYSPGTDVRLGLLRPRSARRS